MITIEQKFALRALATMKQYIGVYNGDQKKLKELLNQATALPLLFHTQGLRIAFMKLCDNKGSLFNSLYLEDNSFGLKDGLDSGDSVHNKLANFSLEENHLYLGRCLSMAEELKMASQILVKPLIEIQ